MPEVHETLARMRDFSSRLRAGLIRAPGGGRFRDVVNIGIGGSDLGTRDGNAGDVTLSRWAACSLRL